MEGDQEDYLMTNRTSFKGLTQGEILLHVFEERLLMQGDRDAYESSHLACFHPHSCQNRHRVEVLGYKSTVRPPSFFTHATLDLLF